MKYKMKAKVVLYPGPSPWHFIYLPKERAVDIKKRFGSLQKGWSSLPVKVNIGKTNWRTSIFYDRRSETYLLPLKAEVRKKEEIIHGDIVTFSIEVGF